MWKSRARLTAVSTVVVMVGLGIALLLLGGTAANRIRLLGQEVLPALRDIGKELGLWSPFEANAPVSLAHPEPARPAGVDA